MREFCGMVWGRCTYGSCKRLCPSFLFLCLLLRMLSAGLQAKPCIRGLDEPVLHGKGDQSTVDRLVVAGPCSCIWSLMVHCLIYTRGIFFFFLQTKLSGKLCSGKGPGGAG